MDYKIIITKFESDHGNDIVEITENSFRYVVERERPKKSQVSKIINTFSETNPAGCSIMAYALVGNMRVACCAAIPFRVHTDFGENIGYQIGSFFVRNEYHGIGIGTKLVEDLTSFFDKKLFLFSYPNKRSISIFLKNGYQVAEIIPTFIYLSGIARIISIFNRRDKEIKLLNYKEALDSFDWVGSSSGLIKDKLDFIWKYSYDEGIYQIYRINFDNINALIITTEHLFMGIRFRIICDIYRPKKSNIKLIIKNFSLHIPFFSILYLNSSTLKGFTFPFFKIPKKLDPRPIIMVNRIANIQNLNFETITSDWMGF